MNKIENLLIRREKFGNIGALEHLIELELKNSGLNWHDLIKSRKVINNDFLLSIIVPAYNAASYLEETVHSLELDKHNNLVEVIIMDDGSKDETFTVAKRLQKAYSNLKVCRQTNSGAGVARNNALEYSRGNFLFFLDADDYVNISELLKATLNALKENADLVFLPYEILYVSASKIDKMYPSDDEIFKKSRKNNPIDIQKNIALGLTGFPWNRLILREMMISEKILFGTTPVHNDIRFHWHSICAAKKIIYHKAVTCTHKKFESGSLSSDRGERRLCVFNAISETYSSIEKYKTFQASIEVWNSVINKMLEWNYKIIDKSLKDEFESLLDKWKKKNSWNFKKKVYYKQDKPLISIVTITWNILGKEEIERKQNLSHFMDMVSSVLYQSYGREMIEHVVIDGDSSDGTKELIEDLHNKGIVDTFISEKDSGIYNAMNKGINYANGQYILYLNAHDKLSLNAIESLYYGLLTNNESDYVFGNSITIDEDDNPVGQHIGDINRIYFGMPYCHQAALYKKDLLLKTKFPESFKITTWRFALDVHLNNYKHVYVNEVIAYFRMGGVSTNENSKNTFLGELKKIKMQIQDMLQIDYKVYSECRESALSKNERIMDSVAAIKESRHIDFNKSLHDDFITKLLSYKIKNS